MERFCTSNGMAFALHVCCDWAHSRHVACSIPPVEFSPCPKLLRSYYPIACPICITNQCTNQLVPFKISLSLVKGRRDDLSWLMGHGHADPGRAFARRAADAKGFGQAGDKCSVSSPAGRLLISIAQRPAGPLPLWIGRPGTSIFALYLKVYVSWRRTTSNIFVHVASKRCHGAAMSSSAPDLLGLPHGLAHMKIQYAALACHHMLWSWCWCCPCKGMNVALADDSSKCSYCAAWHSFFT